MGKIDYDLIGLIHALDVRLYSPETITVESFEAKRSFLECVYKKLVEYYAIKSRSW